MSPSDEKVNTSAETPKYCERADVLTVENATQPAAAGVVTMLLAIGVVGQQPIVCLSYSIGKSSPKQGLL